MSPHLFDEMVGNLARVSVQRFVTAVFVEGITPQAAMKEIVRTIIEAYRDAVAP